MRIKRYSPSEAANQLLQQQVRRGMDKIKGGAIPGPPALTRRTAAANGLQVEVKGAPGRYFSAPISLLPQPYPSYAFECAMLLGWGWRAFERRGGGICIVRTAREDSPPDFNRRLPPSQTTARGRRAGFGSVTSREIRHPPPHTHTSLLVPCPPPSQNAEAVKVVKDKKRRLEYRARSEAALPVLVWKTLWRIRRVLYQQFTYGGEEEEDDASIPAPWTDAE
jgi:hypothetical protein